MGKKKKKKCIVKQSYHSAYNKHHLLGRKKKGRKKHFAHLLRNHDYCIVGVPAIDVHGQIHESLQGIPVPDDEICQHAYECICKLWDKKIITPYDPPKYRVEILMSLFEKAPDTHRALSQQHLCFLRTESGN